MLPESSNSPVESSNKPAPSILQQAIGFVLLLGLIVGGVTGGIYGYKWLTDDSPSVAESSDPTSVPAKVDATPNPTEVGEMLISELEETCPPLIATYAGMTEQGYEYSEIVMSLANNFDMTPNETNKVMMLCAQYGKAVIENQR